MHLLQKSDAYKKTADDFLRSSHLIPTLEKYGRVQYEGAYAGNVMLNGDIDIKVIRQEPFSIDEVFAALRDIHDACTDEFRSFYIKNDWDDPRLGNVFPYGHYIGLKALIDDEKWKFDIWFISEAESVRDTRTLDISKTELSEEQRMKVLEFKQYRNEHGLKTSGQAIYEAVLRDGISEPASFFAFQ